MPDSLLESKAMNLKVVFRGGTRFEIVGRSHTVMTDQPIEDGGQR